MKNIKKSSLIYVLSIIICGLFTIICMFSNYEMRIVPITIGAMLTWELIALPCFIMMLKDSTKKMFNKILWGIYSIVPFLFFVYILIHL